MGEPGEQMCIWIICPNAVLDLTCPQQLLFLLNIMYLVPLRSTLNLMVTVHFTNKSSNLEEWYFWSFCSYPTKPQRAQAMFLSYSSRTWQTTTPRAKRGSLPFNRQRWSPDHPCSATTLSGEQQYLTTPPKRVNFRSFWASANPSQLVFSLDR